MYYSKERYHIHLIDSAFTQDGDWKKEIQTYQNLYLEAYSQTSGLIVSKENLRDAFETLEKIKATETRERIEELLAQEGNYVKSSNSSFLNKSAELKRVMEGSTEYNRNVKLRHLLERLVNTAKLSSQYWSIVTIIGNSFFDKLDGKSNNFQTDERKVIQIFEQCKKDTEEFSQLHSLVSSVIHQWKTQINSG